MIVHNYHCDDPAAPCLGPPDCIEEKRICVIARRADHDRWGAVLPGEIETVAVGQNLYGSRFDLILIDVPREDQDKWFHAWLDQGVRCRLSPNGKLLWVRE